MILCILGPTGVGKTKLSEELSLKYDAIVVNCDAMQVYKEMNIGTAKLKKEENLGQKHYLFDIVSPSDQYTVYDYQKDVRQIIDNNIDKTIILVGGTGLYLKAGLYNYEFSERKTQTYDEYSNEELYNLLKDRNELNDIHINNRRRMISRLNSSGNNSLKDELLYKDVKFIGLTTNREKLNKIIDKRVDKMMEEGLLEEVKILYSKYGQTKALKTGIGYKELILYLKGLTTLEESVRLIKLKSRKYAKRQYTWINHQMNIKWIDVDYENFNNTIKDAIEYIELNS